MPEEVEYFENKHPDRTYISKAIEQSISFDLEDAKQHRAVRILSHVFDTKELHAFAKVKKDIVLRVTPGERQEIKITFYEDTRDMQSITIQKFTRKDGKPHKLSFTFQGNEIEKIYNLFRLIRYIDLYSAKRTRLDDNVFNEWTLSDDEKLKYFLDNSDLVAEITKNHITKFDVIAFAYRKKQLEIFNNLLHNNNFFTSKMSEWGKKRREDVWQKFFEENPWIFGYGLNYIFTSRLDDKKLEQVTTGYSIRESGKRVDALMKTRGFISSLCFVEIKTHRTPLLYHKEPYRPECWRVSDELAGSVSQIQKTVQKAIKSIRTKIEFESDNGTPSGEIAFLYQPKAYVVIGSLDEFATGNKINEQKFSSFELFRRNIVNPEIITFDELFERAKFIVQHSENEKPFAIQENNIPFEEADVPF